MIRWYSISMSVLLGTTLFVLVPETARCQERRRAGPGEGPPDGVTFPRGTGDPRTPYAGIWDGSAMIANGAGTNEPMMLAMVFEVVDSATARYSGATIHRDNGRVRHVNTRVTKTTMEWTQPNSGGGQWVYTAKLVSRDSIAGIFVLRDWPQLPKGEKAPHGTFALARRAAGARHGS